MLRAIDDVDGQGIYIRKLCDALFELDSLRRARRPERDSLKYI